MQRIGLSATCAPAVEVASFLCGVGRSCSIAVIPDTSSLELTVEPLDGGVTFLADLVRRLEPELRANRSTLIFANTRALSERTSWALRHRYPEWEDAIAVHHSALAPARRREIEANLKEGRLRAVVCSTSLELGIDIGYVDGVVLVHPPGDVVRLLQRVGRSGHGPGLVRRGLVLTGSPGELLEAAVTTASGRAGECEPLRVPAHPLDVLCQQLLGMAAARSWTADDALMLVRRAYPYRTLSREDFSACVAYLSGERSDSPLSGETEQWLPARLAWNGHEFRILDERTARLLRRNLGTILAEEPRRVRLTDDTIIGEVEDRFAERLNPGDRFLLDGRCLEYRRNDENGLVVEEVFGRPQTPRWTADGWPLSLELARRLYLLRIRAAEALRGGSATLIELLRDDYGLNNAAVSILADYFERQERVSEVPDAATFLVERVVRQMAADYYLHTPLNRHGNDALARVILRRLGREGRSGHSLVADLGLLIALPGPEITPEAWRRLLLPEGFAEELTAALAEAPALRQRFGKVAQTGLMVLRNPLGRRQKVGGPSWAERRLFDKVRSADPGFVLLKQSEREVRDELCDAGSALLFAQQLARLTVRCRTLTQPSPFVESWSDVAAGPTEEQESPAEALQRLHAALMGLDASAEATT
jgi:ATP-dependent Lhr-like helicase